MTYHVEYFDRHYAEGRTGSSPHTVEALNRRLNEQEANGWKLHSTLERPMGWILIYRRED